jgi:hypothetical protein
MFKGKKQFGVIAFLGGVLALFLAAGLGTSTPTPEKQYPANHVELKPGDQTGSKLQIVGAKNEYLSLDFQVKGADLATFKVQVRERGSGVTPAFNFYQVRPACPPGQGKYQADALVPLDQGLINTGPVLEIWATVKIPPGLAPGLHPGEIIFQDKNGVYRQPLEVKVWNFALPDDLAVPIMGSINFIKERFARYGVQSPEHYDEVLRAYLRSMREYKINSLGYFYPFPVQLLQAGKRVEDFPGFDRMLRYVVNDLNYRLFRVPILPGAKHMDQSYGDFASRAPIYYSIFRDYLVRNNWEKRVLIKIWDEPKAEAYQSLYKAYALVKKVAPGIRTETAGKEPDPQLAKVIDVWVSYAIYYDPAKIAAARAQGQEIWLYANKLHGIDQPLAHQRLIGWLMHNYGYQGYLIWSLNNWPQDPWTNIPGKIDALRRGTFYYPDPKTCLPNPTTRLEALRRGLQDYQYLVLLDQAQQQGRVDEKTFAEIKRQEQMVTQDIKLLHQSPPRVTMQDMEKTRIQVGEILHRRH